MKIRIIILSLIVINSIIGKDEPSLAIYDKLNTFEMISKSQSFKIKTNETSIAYFDSFDGNSIVYITKDKDSFFNQNDERITGKFFPIEPNVEYYVRNNLYDEAYISNFKKYLYPVDLANQNISIFGEKINYLYLKKDNSYILDFKDNTIKKVIKLSRKTPNSKVIVKNKEKKNELSKDSLYYLLEDYFIGKLELQVTEDDAFIEFLSNEGDNDVLKDVEKNGHEIKNKTTLIKIDKTQKDFLIQLNSDKPFKYSFSYGFSNNEKYYYFDLAPNIVSQKIEESYKVFFKILTPFKNIELIENEFFSFSVNVEFEQNQKVFLYYKQESELSSLIDEKLEKEYCEEVKKNLKELFELYVFTDIAKSPPIIEGHPNYHHEPINIQKSLENISCENRYFYEFYQEVMKILTSTKDRHLTICSFKSPKGIIFEQYEAVLPFYFVIKNSSNNIEKGEFKMYIVPNRHIDNCEESIQKFILSHVNIPLKTIDDQDPFDYIQNWSKFSATKNEHAQFTYLMAFHTVSEFYLRYFPLNYSDLNLKQFEFEDNKILRIPYFIITPNPKDVEFNAYFHSYLEKEKAQTEIINIPSINEIRDKYLIHKGIKKVVLKDNKKEEIEWNITIFNDKDQYIKCRVDEKNKVNVVLQTTFSVDYILGIAKIIECAKLFHTNEYPIIIIESKNGGGFGQLYMIMHQLFQMRTVDRSYFSFIMSSASKQYFKGKVWEQTNVKTCKSVKSYDDYKEVTDHYNYNSLKVDHIRSDAVDLLPFFYRALLREFREKYINDESLKKYLKRPTDIIIFTDSYSYSATCGLIKGFQNTGGAIIVGYFGNPKKEGIDSFDGCQSVSSVEYIENFYLYNKLYNLGIVVGQVTMAESFDDSVYDLNPIPREYAFDPVDYRVNIYSSYSDDLYMKFIEEGKKIHAKFNKENYCNSKNDKLLMHSDTCKIEGKEHAHGGYKCNPDNNKWDTNNCQPYYCDIGYYFNQKTKECVKECSFNDTKSYFIYEDIEETYHIQKDQLTVFTFVNEKSNYYFYNFTKDLFSGLPKIGFIGNGTYKINKDNEANDNCELYIKKIDTDFQFQLFVNLKDINKIEMFNKKLIQIFQLSEDYIFYSNGIFNKPGNKIKFGLYNDEMKPEDILLGNDKYFKEYKDNFITLEKDKINIIYIDHSFDDQIHNMIGRKNNSENIFIEYEDIYILYLQKDKEYILDFEYYEMNTLIKLSRKTIDSEIIIKEENITLNYNNLYYQIKDGFNGKIKLEATKSDAIIEFLFKMPNVEVLDYEQLNSNSSKKYILIKFPKKYSGKEVKFNLKNNKNEISFNFFIGYSKPPYSYYYNTREKINTISSNNNTAYISFKIPEEENQLESEYFCALIEKLSPGNLEIFYQSNDKNQDNKGFKTWMVILIIAFSFVILLIIIIIIAYNCIKKNQLSKKEIEDKIESLNKIEDI